eukprot:1138966-Pelagomonas_calceolata.AAC.3
MTTVPNGICSSKASRCGADACARAHARNTHMRTPHAYTLLGTASCCASTACCATCPAPEMVRCANHQTSGADGP